MIPQGLVQNSCRRLVFLCEFLAGLPNYVARLGPL